MDAAKLIELKQSGKPFDQILTLLCQPEEVLELDENLVLTEDEVEFLEAATKNIHSVSDELEAATKKGDLEVILKLTEVLSDTFEMIKDLANEASSRTD